MRCEVKSRPVRGAWIEIRASARLIARTEGRAPYGARGLKCLLRSFFSALLRRAPYGARGLKLSSLGFPSLVYMRRAPYGARGLKLLAQIGQPVTVVSRPVRGAWIEIRSRSYRTACRSRSRPVRGAWIEILLVC